MNLIESFPVGEEVLGVTVFNGQLIVSTNKRFYVLKGNKLEPIKPIECSSSN